MVELKEQGGEEFDPAAVGHPKGPLAAREEEILAFWQREKIFEKSLEKPSPKGEYIFYDGPPFANGLPHYGHILASTIKDAIPRYRTMRGYRVPRRWGWDCHGLPVENLVEKELGFKNKRDIEEYGIEKFNEAARRSIMKDVADWRRIIPRLGRFVDMEHDYKTMDSSYTESVWWAFKSLYDRGLVYEGFKSMHLCPRCGTTLSNFEVAQGYKDIDDIAVTVKLRLVDEPNTSLLIWTTTPWTLPGNVAAAVKEDATYVKVKVEDEYFIVAKELAAKNFGGALNPAGQRSSAAPRPFVQQDLEQLQVVGEFLGKELVGKRYEPPFDYFKNELHKHKTHAWRVYAAPYVTLEDGTGIVHLAPAFGAEDLELAQKNKIPLIHHVTDDGRFIATVKDFAHLPVKPKGNPRETDQKVAEWLREHNLLFKEEKITHSYPHCWRCDTPLLNWAANSWFVNVQQVKSKLVGENKKITWVPEHVGRGRFNNGLESAPDWAISRTRYWGAPIPVWRHSKTKEIKVVGSVEDLLAMVRKSGNNYFVMRHGEALNNVESFTDTKGRPDNHLTERGRAQSAQAAQKLSGKRIDLIITSPLLRAQETAAILQKELGLPDSAVMIDERIRETNFGELDGGKLDDYRAFFGSYKDRLHKAPPGGESYIELRRRVGEFLFELERRYSGKNVLIVMHGGPAYVLNAVACRTTLAEMMDRKDDEQFLSNAAVNEFPFTPYPHNEHYELDLHRPYIDEVSMGDSLNGEWKRVPDVFDCWFESGSMPFASNGYPQESDSFNPKRLLGLWPKGYPADFIAEGLDQTRGWFYSLIVLGTALFGKAPYKNVIVNGLILAADGQKMSKRLKNYPDPIEVVERYGADALRYYLLSSQLVRGEDLRMQEKGVDEVAKKLVMRLDNVRSFYQLYREAEQESRQEAAGQKSSAAPRLFVQQFPGGSSHNVLDRWILSRLSELIKESTQGYERYELDSATRPLAAFIDDLSTWYLRRSRDRFKEEGPDKTAALATLREVLKATAKVMAPVMPFYAEYLYREMREETEPDPSRRSEAEAESVHLCDWPEAGAIDEQLLKDMRQIRSLASEGLQLREKAGLKLRQPLAMLKAKSIPENAELVEVLKDELNVKEVAADSSLESLWLDTTLTDELREEGLVRELARKIQGWRKEQGMQISDRPTYAFEGTDEEKHVAKKYKQELMAQTGLAELIIE